MYSYAKTSNNFINIKEVLQYYQLQLQTICFI